jgi:hypothetical protein
VGSPCRSPGLSFFRFGVRYASHWPAVGNEAFVDIRFHGAAPLFISPRASSLISLWFRHVPYIFITVGARFPTIWHFRARVPSQRAEETHEPTSVLFLRQGIRALYASFPRCFYDRQIVRTRYYFWPLVGLIWLDHDRIILKFMGSGPRLV